MRGSLQPDQAADFGSNLMYIYTRSPLETSVLDALVEDWIDKALGEI
jgi:hypothetical protein